MKNQTLFNRVARHLLKQKRKSFARVNGEIECRYHGPDGLKCAIGCLIPADRYSKTLEGHPAGNGVVMRAAGLSSDQRMLALFLQDVHDGKKPSRWRSALRRVAKEYDLDASVVKGA